MNPSFGTNWSDWALTGIIAIISGLVSIVIRGIYHRIEGIEAALPKRIEQYHSDQERHRERVDAQLHELRLTLNAHAVELSAMAAKMNHRKN